MSFGAVAASVAGAVVSSSMGGGGGGESQTASKEPWEPTRKPLINSINTGQDLERYYQQQPFNRLQQQGYQNLYSDLDQYRNQMQPGLMNFANNMMTSNYQRGPRNSQMEAMQGQMQGMPMQGSTRPQMMQQGGDGVYQTKPMQMPGGGGLLGAMGQGMGGTMDRGQGWGGAMQGGNMEFQGGLPQGLLAAAPQGVFQAPSQGSYGLLDWHGLNAMNSIPKLPEEEKPKPKTPEEIAREEQERLLRDDVNRGAGA